MRDADEIFMALLLVGVVIMVMGMYTAWTVGIGNAIGRGEVCAEICGPHYSTTEPDTLCLCLEVAP